MKNGIVSIFDFGNLFETTFENASWCLYHKLKATLNQMEGIKLDLKTFLKGFYTSMHETN